MYHLFSSLLFFVLFVTRCEILEKEPTNKDLLFRIFLKGMIVDVITSGIHRVQPVIVPGTEPSEVIHTVTEVYAVANPNLVCQYGDAELCDIRAFGYTSGFVRVMGGVRAAPFPHGLGGNGVIPIPATPRVYTFYVNEPVIAVTFAPDGLTLGVLYKSCLVVVANDTRRVFYFGQNHIDTFENLYMSEEYAYVTTTTDEILKFYLLGPDYDLVRLHVPRSVRTFLSETNEWVTYDDARNLVVFSNGDNVLVPAMVGAVRRLVPTLDRNHIWALTNTELVLVCRVEMSTAVLPIQTALVEELLVLPYRMGIVIGWYEEPVRVLHLKSFEFLHTTGEIVQTGSVSVPFHTAPRALALPASPFTRFNTAHALMLMHRLTRADVVFGEHIFPEADDDSGTETESDDEDDDADDEDEDEDDAVIVSFNYPQPLVGLQMIIQRTREYLPTLCESFAHWTPVQFEAVLEAAYSFARPFRLLNQQAAMLLYAKENHKMYAQMIDECVRHFSDFYGGSATMGLLEGSSSEIDFEPYSLIQSRVESVSVVHHQNPEESERVLLKHLKFSETTIGDRLELEALEFRVDMAYHLATQFRGIEADTIHAVNTGIISTMNCCLTEVRDMIEALTFQRKLMKIVARVLTQPDEPVSAKRLLREEDGPPSKKLSGGV